jgi:hypothetical protein
VLDSTGKCTRPDIAALLGATLVNAKHRDLFLSSQTAGPRLTKLEDDVREIKQILERQESSRASSSSRSDRTGKNVSIHHEVNSGCA